MRISSFIVTLAVGCGTQRGAPTAAECDYVWGAPSGYMASACCRTEQDCVAANQSSYQCTAPNTPIPFGFCPPSDCTVDADCRLTSPTAICQQLDCSFGDGRCIDGCTTDATCADGGNSVVRNSSV